jgi:hypothetical protein
MLNPTEHERERTKFIDAINKDGHNLAIESSTGFNNSKHDHR